MEWELRVILAVIGALIIGFVAFDGWRRAQKNRQKSNDIAPMSDEDFRDQEGFDRDGISEVRTRDFQSASEDSNEAMSEPSINSESIIATKDDKFVADESETMSTRDDGSRDPNAEPDLIFSMALLADEEHPFSGTRLLQSLIENGCRYGDMNIFHRSKSAQNVEQKYFSVANAFNPGTFDINSMEKETFKGLTFFMTVPGAYEPETAHQLMVETARKLQQALKGNLVDSSRSVYTEQTFIHELEQIKEHKRRSLVKA